LLLIAVLHFIRDDDNPRQILDTLIDAMPAGGYVAATHVTLEYLSPQELTAVQFVALFARPAIEPDCVHENGPSDVEM
jgi:hypothetical protein